MDFSLGADLVEVKRIKKALNRWGDRFLNRVFTPVEIKYCKRKKSPEISLAARFVAKEAAMKALGTGLSGGVRWNDFEVIRGPRGRPEMKLSRNIQKRLKNGKMLVTLTHTREHAMAVALLVERE
jgi:holo-[acyl-carrier protein] synthase